MNRIEDKTVIETSTQSLGRVESAPAPLDTSAVFPRRIPILVWLSAVLAGLIAISPYWHAQSETPPGWTFTGNVSVSPDMMQYRVWARQTQETGILVANKFTSESNEPHLPVLFYFIVGKTSQWTGVSVELVYAYLGSLFAFALTILLFVVARRFMQTTYQALWVFVITLLGGGLGAHLKLLSTFGFAYDNFLLRRTLVDGFWNSLPFEDIRGNYIFTTLFDTHFLAIWLVSLAALFALYFTLRKPSIWRVPLTAGLYILATLLHVYEGVTLIMITASIVFLLWRKGLLNRSHLVISALMALSVVACMAWQFLLYRSSGLPLSPWRGPSILFSILLIAYPLAWVVIAWGIMGYWRKAGFKECFLLGWILGCTLLTLSGPFYPYPARGTMTLQIPMYIVAGAIYFSRFKRMTPAAALIVILFLGATPVWAVRTWWIHTTFAPDKPYMFMSAEHREVVDLLREQATDSDLLITDKSAPDWKTDDLWLAPEYPGKLYAGHFFLTDDYERKRAEVNRFFDSRPEEQATFLRDKGIRFVFVPAKQNPGRFERVPGLVLLKAATIGSLFEYTGTAEDVGS